MSRSRSLGLLAAGLLLAAVLLPQHLGSPDLDRTATALAVAGASAGAALTLAAGRPNLAVGALAGVGAYVSGALAVRGIWVPVAVLLALAGTAGGGALIALATARLDAVGLLASTLLLTVGLAALTQALPAQSGGQAGLGPLPPLGTPITGSRVVTLTATGDLHALLAAALLVSVIAVALLGGRVGAAWRAVGSDRARAAASGLRPLRTEVVAMAAGGGLAGLGGALSAHVNGVATPELFSPDIVALPLLAALLAGRGNALGAICAGAGTALLGNLVLPALGWRGPPSATALALGLLAVSVVASLLPGPARARRATRTDIDPATAWPFEDGEFPGATLVVDNLDVRAGPLSLLRGFSLTARRGAIHGLVGPNGAGKSTLLGTIAGGGPGVRLDGGGEVVILQPQAGGGFPACTVDETLYLAARGSGRPPGEARALAGAWRARLQLDAEATTLCAELSGGRRRLIDLARVLLRRPAVLLCDEPLAGLDSGARAAAVALLRAAADAGLTIVLAEHDREAVASLASSTTELRREDLRPIPAEASA